MSLPTMLEIEAAELDLAMFFADEPSVEEMLAAICRVETAAFVASESAPVAAVQPAKTFTEALPATKSCPKGGTIRWTPNSTGCRCCGRLAISMGRTTTNYDVNEFACDGGRGFEVRKAFAINGAESYSVFVADARTRDAGFAHDSCECMGFLHTGHCKHLDAVRAILENAFLWNTEPAAMPAPAAKPKATQRPFVGSYGPDQDRW